MTDEVKSSLTSEKAEKVFLITGASRGLGLEMIHQLSSEAKYFIFAAVRHPETSTELKEIASKAKGHVEIIQLDVSDKKSIEKAAEVVKGKTKRIDVLINNAGIMVKAKEDSDPAPSADPRIFTEDFQTNVIGVQVVTQTFLPLLHAAKKADDSKVDPKSSDVPKVINLSSILSSIAKTTGYQTSYSVSKAAMNMLTACYACHVKGIAFIPVDPGWVDTDMGRIDGASPPLTAVQSVTGVLSVVAKVRLEQSGKQILSHDGGVLAW